MNMPIKRPATLLLVLMLLLALACNLPAFAPATPTPEQVIDLPLGTTPENQPPASTATLSPNAPISLPVTRTGHAGDYDSSTTAAARKAAGGDRFTFGRYERPFNANSMDTYFPYIDIVDTTAYADEKYVYGVLVLKGTDAAGGLPGNYAFEIDLNRDGGGDWLILARAPASTQWSTQGVQVWNDANDDAGGVITVTADEDLFSGDGYERLVADSGQGESPEAGWVRIDPNSPNTIDFAISFTMMGSPSSYMAGMWAGTGALDPAKFDFNDIMTHEQAGAADPDLELFYPIKQLAELDNACRMAIGFAARGNEPGICPEQGQIVEATATTSVCVSDPADVSACRVNKGTWNYNKCRCKPCPRPSYCVGSNYVWHQDTCWCQELLY